MAEHRENRSAQGDQPALAITEAMIQAGVEQLSTFSVESGISSYLLEDVVIEVYEAMTSVAFQAIEPDTELKRTRLLRSNRAWRAARGHALIWPARHNIDPPPPQA